MVILQDPGRFVGISFIVIVVPVSIARYTITFVNKKNIMPKHIHEVAMLRLISKDFVVYSKKENGRALA